MAKKAVKKDKDVLKWKKKRWYALHAPQMFSEAFLGETTVMEQKNVIGKVVETSLMNLIGNMRKQNTYIKFEVTNFKDNKAMTEAISYRVTPASIKRIVRRRRDKIEDSFNAVTRDTKVIRIKPIFVTRGNTYNSTLTAIRKEARRLIAAYVASNDYESLFRNIVGDRMQSELYKALSKIYPIKIVDIKFFGLERNSKKRDKILKTIQPGTVSGEEKAAPEAGKDDEREEEEPAPAKRKEAKDRKQQKPARKKKLENPEDDLPEELSTDKQPEQED